MKHDPWNLTPREQEVMAGMVKHGGVAKRIASDMGISPKTVDAFLTRAHGKIGGRTRTAALIEWDRWSRMEEGSWQVCEHCKGAGHVFCAEEKEAA